jgi:hypothetical protein
MSKYDKIHKYSLYCDSPPQQSIVSKIKILYSKLTLNNFNKTFKKNLKLAGKNDLR